MRRYAWYAWKYGLPLLVAAAVGYYFYDKLNRPGLWAANFEPRVEWLIPAAILYLLAYTVWGRYYVTLLRNQGATVATATGLRAYFISQMGKYVPGKVLVIVIRIAMLGKIGISRTAVGITAVYESLVWGGAGAAVGILLLPPSLWDGLRAELQARGGNLPAMDRFWLILPLVAAPIGLVGLNRFVNRVNRWRKGADAAQLPRVKLHMVVFGLLFDSIGWLILGGSLLMTLRGLQPNAGPLTFDDYFNLVSIAAIAYVLGFAAFFMPAGVGVRDIALQLLLAVELRSQLGANVAAAQLDAFAAMLAVMFRLMGTAMELITAALMYRFAPPAAREAVRHAVIDEEGEANE
jgi:glycosyltransferase 2 family protein